MKKIRKWFIGEYLDKTTNVFEKARIELLFNFTAFYLLNLLLFYGNLIANHYHYHAAIITFGIFMLLAILVSFKRQQPFHFIALLLFLQQTITGIVSYLIQESQMDFVGEFWMVVNILMAFVTLGKRYGLLTAGIWLLQLIHCLLNDFSGGKYVLIHIPQKEILPPAPFFVLVPFFLCIYIMYQFVQTRTIAERNIQEQKDLIEEKNHEILSSIRYAKRIQNSLLPTEKYLEKVMKQQRKS
jgi:hypothetical protein